MPPQFGSIQRAELPCRIGVIGHNRALQVGVLVRFVLLSVVVFRNLSRFPDRIELSGL